MGKRITALFIGALCLAGGLAAQTPQPILKGKVIDRGGETVIGAHVKWKNAQGGAVTDLDGNFSIPETGTELVISFLGYKTQTIKIKPGQKNLVITLEDDAQDLDELVVVGYGTQKESFAHRLHRDHQERRLAEPADGQPRRSSLRSGGRSAGHANHR